MKRQPNEGRRHRRTVPPNPANPIWRVLLLCANSDNREEIRSETAIETEALLAFRDLRQQGIPAFVVRWRMYRVRIGPKGTRDVERFAFVEAYSENDACSRVASAIVGFDRCELLNDIRARLSAESDEDLRSRGVSTDPDLRLFETSRSGRIVTGWVREPMFLLPTPSMLTLLWARIPDGEGPADGNGPMN
jgi:hypothetical protein